MHMDELHQMIMFAVIVFIGSLFIESAKLTGIHRAYQLSILAFMTNVPARKLPERALPFISFLTCSQVGTSPLHCPSEHLRVWGLISRETLGDDHESINLDVKVPNIPPFLGSEQTPTL